MSERRPAAIAIVSKARAGAEYDAVDRLTDPIDIAGAASFPCSDPPYWTLGLSMSGFTGSTRALLREPGQPVARLL